MPLAYDETSGLTLGGVPLSQIVHDPTVGTPAYVYDLDGIAEEPAPLHAAFEGAAHLIAYAIKANSAGAIVRTLREAGCGADVVSAGELSVALGCGIPPNNIVFSGVAKLDEEIDFAIATGEG